MKLRRAAAAAVERRAGRHLARLHGRRRSRCSGGAGRASPPSATRSRRCSWEWVVVAIALNLASVVVRALAWRTVINQATRRAASRQPARLLGVLGRPLRERRAAGPHRRARARRRAHAQAAAAARTLGDARRHRLRASRVRPRAGASSSILYVVRTAKIPAWAITSLLVFVGVGAALFTFAFASARRPNTSRARRRRRGAADRDDGAAGPRRDALAARRDARDPPPDRRLDLPAPRRVGCDARVPHPCAAPGGGASCCC